MIRFTSGHPGDIVTVSWHSGQIVDSLPVMDIDFADPPVDPPAACRYPLLWRLARALWQAHVPNADGFCTMTGCQHEHRRTPCPARDLATQGMRSACGESPPSSRAWLAATRRRITSVRSGLSDQATPAQRYRPVGERSITSTYRSYAFRQYARAQVDYADAVLVKHAEDTLGLCRCGRNHPCHDREHWQGMRAHYVQFTGEPSTWPAPIRPYVRAAPDQAR